MDCHGHPKIRHHGNSLNHCIFLYMASDGFIIDMPDEKKSQAKKKVVQPKKKSSIHHKKPSQKKT